MMMKWNENEIHGRVSNIKYLKYVIINKDWVYVQSFVLFIVNFA